MLGLLCIIFGTLLTELCPLIDVGVSFPLNILRTNGQIFTNFIYVFILTRYRSELLPVSFAHL